MVALLGIQIWGVCCLIAVEEQSQQGFCKWRVMSDFKVILESMLARYLPFFLVMENLGSENLEGSIQAVPKRCISPTVHPRKQTLHYVRPLYIHCCGSWVPRGLVSLWPTDWFRTSWLLRCGGVLSAPFSPLHKCEKCLSVSQSNHHPEVPSIRSSYC